MLKLIKELKPFTLLILIIIALLFVQAMADLALPDYMSNIVNVGIQQSGVESSVPEVIKASEMDKIKIFLNEAEKDLLNESYKIVNENRDNLNEKEYKEFVKKYPNIVKESLYILNTKDEENIEKIDTFLGKAILMVSVIEKRAEKDFQIPEGTDPFLVLGNMPKEQIDALKVKIDEKIQGLPETIITQSAIMYIKSQYEAMGINMHRIQSNYIIYIGGIMLLVALLGMVASILVGFLAARISASFGRNLREKVFKKVVAFSNTEFDKFSTASLITRSTNDIQQVQQVIFMMLRIVFFAPILGIGGVIKALKTNISMAWIVALGVICIFILVITLFVIVMPKFKKLQKLVDKVNLVMRESLTGMMVIRAFNTQKFEEEKFDNVNRDLTKTSLFVTRILVMMMPVMMLIMNGIILLIIWVGAHEIDKANIQVGDMMAFMQYAMQIIMSFLIISMVSIILPRASVSAQRIAEILDEDLSIKDPENPKKLGKNVKGLIQFKNVSFKYPGAEEYVLKDISFTARPGETIAFIGSTGSGKSTLVNLIPRFYDITEGEILFDGTDIRDVALNDLRERIGYVPQKGVLFTGTIESNIKYGKNTDATEEEVLKAIEIAQASDFIDEKTEGILSEVSQGGTNVSGGQKQRLSIARALAKRPEVFIFDDSFSALDFKTDAALRKAIDEDIKDRTILIVAQRINTIMNAENIVVLDGGKIVGMGTHEELLKSCKVYKQIALSQLSEEELAI